MSLFSILICSAAAACAARLPRQPPQPPLNSNDIFRRQSGGPLYGNDTDDSPYWLGNLLHQCKAPFHMTGRNYTEGNDTMGNYTTVTYIATNGTGRNITERYLVFRNVKDYGARGKPMFFFECSHRYLPDCQLTNRLGDGFTDDTAAINPAISSGGRGAPGVCQSSTTSPANVYFPSGTYRVSSPIIDYYFTQIIGNPNNLPTIKATTNFSATAVIDGNPLSAW